MSDQNCRSKQINFPSFCTARLVAEQVTNSSVFQIVDFRDFSQIHAFPPLERVPTKNSHWRAPLSLLEPRLPVGQCARIECWSLLNPLASKFGLLLVGFVFFVVCDRAGKSVKRYGRRESSRYLFRSRQSVDYCAAHVTLGTARLVTEENVVCFKIEILVFLDFSAHSYLDSGWDVDPVVVTNY